MLNERLTSALDDLTNKIGATAVAYLGQGIIKAQHEWLDRILLRIKTTVQVVEPRLALSAFSVPGEYGFCLLNFDLSSGAMDQNLDDKLKTAIDELTRKTMGDTGIYVGRGIVDVLHASLARVLPQIKATVQLANHFMSLTAISSPDKNGLCLLNFDKTR